MTIALATCLATAAEDHAGIEFFEFKVRPLLIEHCYECHSAESGESEGELRLDSAAATLRGGTLGPAIVPKHPERSLLVRAIEYKDSKLQMPPDGKLVAAQIDVLRHWIEIGAPDPREESPISQKIASPLDRDPLTHWAFNLPHRRQGPAKADSTSRDLIDAFATQRAAEKGLSATPTADKETLIRRLYFDLTGFSPSREEIDRFIASSKPDAYVRLVDSLLASPAFAERFGRHWLDVARYADTIGYTTAGKERRLKGSERYRDWTIRAFASDVPYDEMIRLQLSADRIDPNNEKGNLDAMGFITIGRKYLNGFDTIDDRIDVISRGLLGLTVTCARRHDHKFDPIPSSDYYSMLGIFASSTEPDDGPSPLMMKDKPQPSDSHVFLRGQPGNRGPIAPRQYLAALRKPGAPRFVDGSGRSELAARIASPENPLTARVMVNRLWAHLIGKPLVDSPSDFGFRTMLPAVPEVLDDLAAEFAQHWSIKRLVRRIVLTRMYRQSSEAAVDSIEKDPDNFFLARANRRRRDFESLRDTMLCAANYLDRAIGGESVEITLSTPSPRRSVYAFIDRQNLPSIFRTFDFASPDAHSPGRYFTTVPQQALFLLNNQRVFDLSRRAADQVRRQTGSDEPHVLAKSMFRRLLSRDPSEQELAAVHIFLSRPTGLTIGSVDPRSLWRYGTGSATTETPAVDFRPFKVFKNNRWQVAQTFPSPGPLGYAYLGSESGHTGGGDAGAVVRRWVAPATGNLRVIGVMGHRAQEGDGIQATIWAGQNRLFTEKQKSNDRPYGPISTRVTEGQFVDFVAGPGENTSNDTFYWQIRIQLAADDGRVFESDSKKDFSGPFDPSTTEPLDRLAQLAQTLMMSNEFAFVD